MLYQANTESPAISPLPASQVYLFALLSLLVGFAVGYLFGSPPAATPKQTAAAAMGQRIDTAASASGNTVSLEELKRSADRKAAPIVEKLKSEPNNSDLLYQAGVIYQTSLQYQQAIAYYSRAMKANPGNVNARTELASCLFRNGDADGAIAQLNEVLRLDPTNANALFNLGVIELHSKQDSKGALAAWQRLLNTSPQLSPDRRAAVQKLIAQVKGTASQ